MMDIRRYSNIHSIARLWLSKDGEVSPLQTYFPNKKYFETFYRNIKKWRLRPIFYVAQKDGKVAIFPLIEDKRCKVLSGFAPLDYYDVISADDILFIKESTFEILNKYRGWKLSFNRINEDGKLLKMLSKLDTEKEICVKIEIPRSYEEYWSNLSKHQRQNIRTANNHLMKDNIVTKFECFGINNKVPAYVWKECQAIYKNRRSMKARVTSGILKQAYKDFSFPLFRIINRDSPISRLYVLSLDNKPVAFAFGMIDMRKNSFYTPILSCNTDYSIYSPGHILICEMVKSFINEGILTFDLARGDEPYKYAMGGLNHYNYSFCETIDDKLISDLVHLY